jgi:prepilin signal peptidase PulO-like enzyme (type II secretory pathway)
VLLNAIFIVFKKSLEARAIDADVMIVANLLLFLLCIIGIYLQQKGLSASGTPAFLRSVYSAMMLKMFVCIIVFFIYAYFAVEINKPALFASMGLYVLYTGFEVGTLMSTIRKKKHA